MIVWTLVVTLASPEGSANISVHAYENIEQCEAAGKEKAKILQDFVQGTRIDYTLVCVQQDFVVVAKGSDPLKI